MAVFTQPTSSEFLNTIVNGGDGAQFYSWDEEAITRNSSSMIPIIPNEFAYASGLLTAAIQRVIGEEPALPLPRLQPKPR